MAIASAILGLLGLAPQFEQAATLITATRDGIEGVNALKELLTSDDGEKFKKKMIELLGGSSVTPAGTVVIDAKKEEEIIYRHGEWVPKWDALQGWVYEWKDAAP